MATPKIQYNNLYLGEEIEQIVRERFKNIIGGKGLVIPRIAIQVALDDLFGKPTLRTNDPD